MGKALRLSNTNKIFMQILIQGFAGLIIVDNIHFQYNTLLYGIFILSIAYAFEEKFIQSALVYTFLLNMKHIFLYVVYKTNLINFFHIYFIQKKLK